MTELMDGLIHAFILDGKGGGVRVGWHEIDAWSPDQGVLWVHLDVDSFKCRHWLRESAGLHETTYEALTADETRPHCGSVGEHISLNLRGMDRRTTVDDEDWMASIRCWVDGSRVLTVQKGWFSATDQLVDWLAAGNGPDSAADFLINLTSATLTGIEDVIDEIDDAQGEIEDMAINARNRQRVRSELAEIRRRSIRLRRFLSPQRDALARLSMSRQPWIDRDSERHLRLLTDRMTRQVEDLDAARERSMVTQEEMGNLTNEDMNRKMYVLSVVTSVCLPPSVITGLLGANVDGIPGAHAHWAFLMVTGLLVGMIGFQLYLFRRLRWL